MMMRSFLVAVTSLLLCQAALAQNVSARIDWYGVYTAQKSEEIDDPTSPTGKRFITTPVPPASNTDQIPGRDNVRFGYSYTVTGGRAGSLVTVKHVYRFPGRGMPDKSPAAGAPASSASAREQDGQLRADRLELRRRRRPNDC